MKKSTGSILLLSAFAALVLAGCGDQPKDSSSTTGSSDTAVQTSADETSAAGTSATTTSAAGTSTAGTSATGTSAAGTSTASSSAAASSSSSAAASSSTPAVETDWSQKSFIGEYKGGMNNLIINADKTTSWGTSTDKFPATYTDMGGGVYMIKSTAAVADEDYVEVITDGTMAYVMHDKEAYDYYVMDKNALGSAVIAFAETQDEENFFGGIEVTAGHWKYFACIGGTYTFGATITMQAGTNINAGGAIFDYGTGANKTSWKVTSGAVAATSFATIEQTNFTATTYTGDHGDLVIGTDNDGLVFAKLNGVMLDGASLSADGSVLSVPNGSTATSVDTTDPAGPMKVVATTTYTLAKIALTYTEGEGTMKTPLFATISGENGTYSAETDESGNVWVVYIATESGTLDIEETNMGVSDSYIQVYESTAANYTSTTTALDYDDNMYAEVSASVTVQAGHAYVIKLGAYADRTKNYNGTGSANAGCEEEFDWIFTAFTHDIYTGDAGDLDLMMDGADLMSITLNGADLGEFVKAGNTITTVAKTMDTSNPTDVVITTTSRTITIDPTTNTYTLVSSAVDEHPFGVITETDTSFSGVTGNDGSIWVTFTPTTSGAITVIETQMGVSDSYLQIFEFDPATGLADLTSTGAKRLGYSDANPATVTINVNAGVTYVIKLGAWASRNSLIGDTASSTANIGCAETFSFSFVDYIMTTYTGADGDLVVATKDGEFKTATLNGTSITGPADYDAANGTLAFYGAGTYDITTDPDNPTRTSTDTLFTLDSVNGTYTKSTPTNVRNVVATLDETSTGYSQATTEDGNIWASFTPTVDGYIYIDETVKCDDYTTLAVYEKLSTSTWSSYEAYSSTYTGQKSLAYTPTAPATSNSYGAGKLYVHDLRVQAGHTYIIKAGTSGGDYQTIGGSVTSTYADAVGQTQAFTFAFAPENVLTYTGDNGNLTLTLAGDKFLSAKLGTSTINNGSLSANGKSFTVPGAITNIHASDPLDPTGTQSSTVYFLDNSTLTYESSTESEEVHLFHEVQATDTSFTGTVGADGNLWGKFTATEDGYITVEETVSTSTDGYIQVFESTATTFTTSAGSGRLAYADSGAALSGAGKITKLAVQAGHTYIIKAGAWGDRDKVIGGTGSSYAGKTETVAFTYLTPDHDVYTGAEGDLDKKSLEGTYVGATLNGQPFTATPNADQTVYVGKTTEFVSDDMTVTNTTKTYTLGEGTYEVDTVVENIDLLADTWTAGNSGTYETLDNGSVIIKFTPTADGEYTFNLAGVTGTDVKFGLYAATFDNSGFKGNALIYADDGMSGAGETFTYELTAGTTYYIRATAHYSDWSKAITSMTSTRGGVELAIEVVDPTPAP